MFKKIFRKINKNKKLISMLALVLFLGIFVIGSNANATIAGSIALALGWIIYPFIELFSTLTLVLMDVLVGIFQYNAFISAPPVIFGWVIVRDLCNMFFILILLVIAFATILRVETYSIKKMLPKLLIMAVLINFSRTICGLFIDFSQVIMLSFVNSFKDLASGNLTEMLGMPNILSFSTYTDQAKNAKTTFTSTLGTIILGLIFSVVALIVMCVLLAVLVVRIVMLWIYIVLSPIAYLTAAFPQGAKISSQWWGDFSKNLVVGPMLAFFIWLAFSSMQGVTKDNFQEKFNMSPSTNNAGELSARPQAGQSEAGTPEHMIKFVISIGMLLGGLVVTQRVGGVFGDIASKGMNAVQTGKTMALSPFKKVGDSALDKAKSAGRLAVDAGRATLGAGDRLVGRGLVAAAGKLNIKKDGIIGKTGAAVGSAIAGGGLVGGTLKGVWNMPNKAIKWTDDKLRNNERKIEAIRNAEFQKQEIKDSVTGKTQVRAIANLDDKKYALNNDGKYQEVKMGKDGKTIEKWEVKEDGTKSMLTNDSNGKAMGAMGAGQMAFYDSWKKARSGAEAMANKKGEEGIEKEQKNILDSNMSKEEMLREFSDASISQTRKQALAMTLALKKGFRNHEDAKKAKESLGSNSVMKGKFDDAVYAGQAHLAFDLNSSDKEIQKNAIREFQNKIDSGKIDSTKLDDKAYKDKTVMSALEEYHGNDFESVIKTAYKRGKKYEEAIGEGLLATRDPEKLKEDKSAKIFANVTGKIGDAFKKNDGVTIDVEALGSYLKSAKAKDVNNISKKELDKIIVNNDGSQNIEVKNVIKKNVSYSQLKSMNKQGDNSELVRAIRDMHLEEGRGAGLFNDRGNRIEESEIAKKIKADDELITL